MLSPTTSRAARVALAASLTWAAACGRAEQATSTTSTSASVGAATEPSNSQSVALADVRIRLSLVAEVDEAIDAALRPGESTIYIASKAGRVVAADDKGETRTVLDIASLVLNSGERGLLGIAFSPDGSRLYVHYSEAHSGDTRLDEFVWDTTSNTANAGSRRNVLSVEQPFANHNGGRVAFGPDGLLYLGLGDGGSAGDPHGNGQSRATLLGKILRIDPRPDGPAAYRIPADNPFVSEAGARGEIWSYGLRNPWRFSFDPLNGDLWIGDVGQNEREEINLAPAAAGAGRGANFGWALMEGDREFSGPAPPNHAAPVFTYGHSEGDCSVTGGVVARTSGVGGLDGAYLYADLCGGRILALRVEGSRVVEEADLGVSRAQIVSFAHDAEGRVLVVNLGGTVERIDPA